MLQLKNVSYSISGRDLFNQVSFTINPGEIVGLVGENGAGKTTLLNIIAGNLTASQGMITKNRNLALFLLDAGELLYSQKKVAQVLAPYWYQASMDLRMCEQDLGERPDSSQLLTEYEDIFERFESLGGYSLENELLSRLESLELDSLSLSLSLENLSGGEKIKVGLSGLLSGNFDIALLDEPTNNLDFGSRKWLIDFLKSRPESFLIVSHDRDFLDSVCSKTLVLDAVAKRVTSYGGNYSWAVNRRKEEKEREKREQEVQKRLLRRLEEDVRSTKEQALKTESETTNDYIRGRSKKVALKAKAREHRLNKIIETEKIKVLKDTPKSKFDVDYRRKRNSTILYCQSIDVGFEGRLLIRDLSLEMQPGERLAIVGNNGAGKSYLVKTLLGLKKPLSGEVILNEHHSIGYMSQNRLENRLDQSIIDLFRERAPDSTSWTDGKIREHLSAVRIFLADRRKKVCDLSEGERTKLELSLILLSKPSMLILDEPTNHLDIDTIEEIEETLNRFEGALIVVTHDTRLVEKVNPQRLWEITNQRIQEIYRSSGSFSS